MSIEEKWDSGFGLYRASHEFTNPYQVKKYQDARDGGARQAIQTLIFAELFDLLAENELQAIGYQVKPNPQRGLEVLPPHIFNVRPSYDDCMENVVNSRGWRFEDVRVCEVSGGPSEPLSEDAKSKGKGGRPSTYDKSKVVLDELYEIESNRGKKAQKLHSDFVKAFERRFPLNEYRVPAPCDRTLREHIKKYWQEPEETGKN